FKSKDPDRLREWYRKHLGINVESWGGYAFQWKDDPRQSDGSTVWSIFSADTKYLDPSTAPFMINFRVADLAVLLTELRAEGVEVDPKMDDSEFGKFGWVMDPDGNRIELWEPPTPANPAG
ncbi:MAG TPA: VOC family protein, partial [Pyrinomonadaceae bacterium]|nr:VOC family protein [Pyrinomonadaceae bacterium]